MHIRVNGDKHQLSGSEKTNRRWGFNRVQSPRDLKVRVQICIHLLILHPPFFPLLSVPNSAWCWAPWAHKGCTCSSSPSLALLKSSLWVPPPGLLLILQKIWEYEKLKLRATVSTAVQQYRNTSTQGPRPSYHRPNVSLWHLGCFVTKPSIHTLTHSHTHTHTHTHTHVHTETDTSTLTTTNSHTLPHTTMHKQIHLYEHMCPRWNKVVGCCLYNWENIIGVQQAARGNACNFTKKHYTSVCVYIYIYIHTLVTYSYVCLSAQK